MPKVSIIVPIYNAQEALNRCIDSILNQEYTDFELILADDGSQDHSGVICDAYAQKDPRVRVIHKKNTGVSDTRNCAIEVAKGEYLQFVDADDWITADATKLMVREAEEKNCELIITDFYRVVGQRVSQKGSIKDGGILTREELAENMRDNPADFYYGVLWNKLFRKDLIETYHIRMDEKISWCEDFLFNLEYIQHVKHVSILTIPVYYYMKTEGSLVSQSMDMAKVVRTKLRVFEYYMDFYKNIYEEKDYQKKRLGLYRYLIDIADDGAVTPVPFINKKLGEEQVIISNQAVDGRGYLRDHYRNRKLLERYYQRIGLKYELSVEEVKVLAYISQSDQMKKKKELADYVGMTTASLNRILQKLSRKKMIEVESEKQPLTIQILEIGQPVIKELKQAFLDYDSVRFQGFTQEEMKTYASFQNRIEENLSRILKN